MCWNFLVLLLLSVSISILVGINLVYSIIICRKRHLVAKGNSAAASFGAAGGLATGGVHGLWWRNFGFFASINWDSLFIGISSSKRNGNPVFDLGDFAWRFILDEES